MPGQIPTGDIHHLRLTVTDLTRSLQFYTSLLGFQVAVESPPPDDPAAAEMFKILFGGVVMVRGNLLLGLRPVAPDEDHFDPDGWVSITLASGCPAGPISTMRCSCSVCRACGTARSPACRRSASRCSRSRIRMASSSS
jgi:glyoxalase/bleomycin resistance protein/dioxygenase superfamily protein